MIDAAPSQAELEGLRERCYRPGSSVATVEAYLAAVARSQPEHPQPVAAVRAAPGRRSASAGGPEPRAVRSRRTIAIAAAAVVVAGAAIGAHALSAVPGSVAPRPSASAGVPTAPPVPGNVLARFDSDGPWTSGELDAGGRRVVLTGQCRGEGTYDVRIGGEPATTLVCDWGGPSYAMLSSTHPLHRFTVTVSATPGQASPQWAFSVGTLPDGDD